MNERIKELAEQAEEHANLEWPNPNHKEQWKNCRNNYFAELIRADDREQISHTYLKLTLEAVLREREACAKLCEEIERANLYGVKECAVAIRQRGEK